MKRFTLVTHTCSMALALVSAFLLSACSGSGGSNTPSYTGTTTPAVINAGNAEDIATKSVGVGFLPDTTGSAVKAVTSLSRNLTSPESKFSRPISKASEPAFDYYEDIFDGELLPGDIFNQVDDLDFPNASAQETYERTVTTEDDHTFIVTSVFSDAVHYTGTDSDRYIYTLNGTVTESYRFEYESDDFTWTDETAAQKLQALTDPGDAHDPSYVYTQACSNFRQNMKNYWDADTSLDPVADPFDMGIPGYETYDNTRETTYTLDGTYQATESETNATGETSETESRTFEGSIEITETYTDGDSQELDTMTLSLRDGTLDLSLSQRETITTADGITTTTTPGDTFSAILRGNILYEFAQEDEYEKSSGTLTLGNTQTDMLTLSRTYQEEEIDYPDDHDPVYEEQSRATMDLSVAGDAHLTVTTMDKTVDPEDSETMTLDLTSGNLTVNMTEASSRTEIILDGNSYSSPDRRHSENNVTASLTGEAITLGYLGESYTLTGALDVTYTYVRSRDAYDEPDTENSRNLLVDMDNLRLSSHTLNLALHGSIDYTEDNLANEAKIGLNLIFHNNGKTYKYEDYTLTMAGQDLRKKAVDYTDLDIKGRFYHHDYGYVDLSTNRTPFVINGYFIPMAGTLTLTGGDNSSATLTCYSPEPDVLSKAVVSRYMYSVSANGDEVATGVWPDLTRLLRDIPFSGLLFGADD